MSGIVVNDDRSLREIDRTLNNSSARELEEIKQKSFDELDTLFAAKREVNFERMLNLALKVIAVQMRLSGRFDHQQILDHCSHTKEHVMNVKRTYNNTWGLCFTLISATLSIGGGLMGFAPLTGTSLFTSETAKSIAKLSSSVGSVGTGFHHVSGVFESKAGGERYAAQHYHEEHKKKIEELNQSRNQTGNRGHETNRTLQDVETEKHRAFGQAG